VDVRVDTPGGGDQAFTRDDLRTRADDDVDARLHIGIAGLSDAGDTAFLQADVRLDDAPVVDDQRVGDDGVRHLGRAALSLPHAVPDDFAAAELDLFSVDRVVALDFDDEFGVAEAHAITRGRAVHLGVGAPVYGGHRWTVTEACP
jgi:hypothetical protein